MKQDVKRLIYLSDLLSKCEDIKRAIKLPHGSDESDSHHAFSLAVIAYDICKHYKIDVDIEKVLLYALVHDLLEIVTGDEATLMMTDEELELKRLREEDALQDFERLLQDYPDILKAFHEYERLDNKESATVFVLDKSCTVWTHFHDNGENLRYFGITSKGDIHNWYQRLLRKINKRLVAQPPSKIMEILHESYVAMEEELFPEDTKA